ncbi:hypothetical protein ACFOWU_10045 [Epilithonimonas zeae]|uniref:Uncharacterized protein n=1 Tax=Epilithonimonas zeae TaxID=1416779 RepID=A0A1N6GW16_9FLAO|nr:hypothetical protein [Epilithonimonas zeae]SIO11781.1 hypothetical protein SAMN05444409_2093 [Epilithonimonas zeae]
MNDLQKAFAALKARSISTFPAEVISVDKESGTCTVDDGEIQYEDVQLSSIVDGKKNQLFIFPLVGSSVLVSPIEEDINWLYVEVYSEVEAVDWKIDNVNFNIDKDGFLLKKENETLKKLMVDLITAIRQMKFTTNTGSTITLVNDLQFESVENRFKNFLK